MKATLSLRPVPMEYPFLGISTTGDSLIVLFASETTGTVLTDNSKHAYRAGYFADDWDAGLFEPLSGYITLSND